MNERQKIATYLLTEVISSIKENKLDGIDIIYTTAIIGRITNNLNMQDKVKLDSNTVLVLTEKAFEYYKQNFIDPDLIAEALTEQAIKDNWNSDKIKSLEKDEIETIIANHIQDGFKVKYDA